ncbi:unnamed protein product [Brachionus calyciflorus]|uniref:Reverse transcriptase domain-containing protein n=1 Tax=Brachionus calyciflorus TaxID=104777 RepID=A0A813Z2I9_9BILA|nr:unnamed protein product [Brachionus calyciflorus]
MEKGLSYNDSKKRQTTNKPSSYRPISLLCSLCKLLGKIVNIKLQNWLEKNKKLPSCQAGFRKGRSTHEQILRIIQSITEGFNDKKLTAAIYYDVEKAFDKSSHKGIEKKLK